MGLTNPSGWAVRAALVALVLWSVLPAAARASQVVSTSAVAGVRLGVNARGQAMVSYRAHGVTVHVLAFGAVNALDPTTARRQVALTLQYDGGYRRNYARSARVRTLLVTLRALQAEAREATVNRVRFALGARIHAAFATLARLRQAATGYWRTFTCPAYDGPPLAWASAACTAPDGSHWAVQQWQRQLPNYGLAPVGAQSAAEVHLAHWTGPLAVLAIGMDVAYRRYDHLFGAFTYRGRGVHGFHSTPQGVPLDAFGRNLYVDTYDSAYGGGWFRENSFLTHNPTGTFCYGFYPHSSSPPGRGTRYRATIIGPGVTPDVMWQGGPPAPYDAVTHAAAADAIRALGDPLCKPV